MSNARTRTLIAALVAMLGCDSANAPDKPKEVRRDPKQPPSTSGNPSTPSTPASPGSSVEITFEYSTEKKEWVEASVATFEKSHPNIRVKLVAKGSLDAADAILDGSDQPTLWSPADSLVANLLASDWKTKHDGGAIWSGTPEPLVLSPLVYVVWEDRAKVLVDGDGQLSWKTIHKAVASPRGWPAIGGKPGWGFVKLGHTDPNKSNSGLQALMLMAFEHFNKTSGITVESFLDPKFQTFVKEIESAVPHFEASTGTFMTDMIRFGPSKYDIAVVYESLAISQLENAQGRWGSLHIYYPPVTIWSDHPVMVLDTPKLTKDQRAAAQQLVAFLKSKDVQTTALRYGFRPADPQVPLKADGSPFEKMTKFGLSLDLPSVAQPPDGPVVRALLMMWSRVVKAR